MRRTKTVLVAVFMTVRQLTLRHAWALSAFTVLTGLVLSVSLVVPSEASRARESVARSSTPEEPALLREENSAAHSQYVENSSPEPSLPGVSRRGGGLPRTILDEKIPPGSSRPRGPQDAIDPDSRNFVSQGSIADGPILREEHFSPYSQVVDNSMPGRFRAPGWDVRSSNPDGYHGAYRVARPSKRAKLARFKVEIPTTDVYSVYAWWPANRNKTPAARFGISTTSGVSWTRVNQRRDGGFWVKLGEYDMEAGDRYAVRVSAKSRRAGYVAADAVAVVRGVLAAPLQESHGKATGEGATHPAIEGEHVVEVARDHIGTYYRHSPPLPCRAFSSEDCSCLTKLVFSSLGMRLPDNPIGQWQYGRSVAKAKLRPGDLVFFKEGGPSYPITHTGIYSGHGNLIHASSYFGKVVESKMGYVTGYYGAKRL